MIAITCPACQKKLALKNELTGKKLKCPGCGASFTVAAPVIATSARQDERRTVSRDQASEMATLPPAPADPNSLPSQSFENPDATLGVQTADGHDAGLTDFLAPPQSAGELGRLGKYRILKVLGHGAMGAVFLGDDITLGRKVAIKVMLPHLAQSRSSQQRFLREAKTAAALEHDNIVPIFHVDEDCGAPYIVMPLLKGESLEERLMSGTPLALADILRIGRETARGLDAAHKIGLIHRDIKPANLWLEAPEGRVKILDFGLARAASDDSSLTQQGAIIGTPAYMAPEQGRGEAVDARGDLFSLGVVLYRLCTGKLPFQGKDTVSTLMSVATDVPAAPSTVKPGLLPELSDLIMNLLEKHPVRRPTSPAEVVQTIEALERQLAPRERTEETAVARNAGADPQRAASRPVNGIPVSLNPRATKEPAGPGKRRRLVALAAIAIVAVVGLVAGGIWFFGPTARGPDRGASNASPIKAPGEQRTVNLLELLDIQKDITRGDWSFAAEGLKSARGDPIAVAEFPYSPPDEYDFRIEFTCVSGVRQVNQFLARRDRSFSCILGAQRGNLFALEIVAGKAAGENPTTRNRAPMTLKARHVCIARVRNHQVAIELDGSELIRWNTDYSELSLDNEKYKHWAQVRRNRGLLAIGNYGTETIFHKAEVVEISGKGAFWPR
jgi:serine/threonine protein kinase